MIIVIDDEHPRRSVHPVETPQHVERPVRLHSNQVMARALEHADHTITDRRRTHRHQHRTHNHPRATTAPPTHRTRCLLEQEQTPQRRTLPLVTGRVERPYRQ